MTASPIPISVLAGFLGSGKTTLLNQILEADHGLRLAVLVNDFGAVNIDAELLGKTNSATGKNDDLISLPNGCICCTLFTSLISVIKRIQAMPTPPDRIVLEASGVSAPGQLEALLAGGDLPDHVYVDEIITLVDAANVRMLAEIMPAIEEQIVAADIVVLNKIDEVEPGTVDHLCAWIRELAPRARILPTTYAKIPLTLLLDHSQRRQGAPASPATSSDPIHNDHHEHSHEHHHDHTHEFESWLYRAVQPLARHTLLHALESLPPAIYRVKGILHLAESPEQWTTVQVVGQRVQLSTESWSMDGELQSGRLVFIGRADATTSTNLKTHLAKFLGSALQQEK